MVARSRTPQATIRACFGRLPAGPFLLPWSALPLWVMPCADNSCRSHSPDEWRSRLRFHSGTRKRSWSGSRQACRPNSRATPPRSSSLSGASGCPAAIVSSRAAGAGRRRLDRQLPPFWHDVHEAAARAERQRKDRRPSESRGGFSPTIPTTPMTSSSGNGDK